MIVNGLNVPVGMSVVPGGPAGTALGPVQGIDVGDSIVRARMIDADGVDVTGVGGEISIVDADTVQLSTTDSTGNFVWVLWAENE